MRAMKYFKKVGTFCSELRLLDVSGCSSTTEVGIGGVLKRCAELTVLRIDRWEWVRNLGSDLKFSKLEVLTASSSGIGDEGLRLIGKGCPRLRMLDLRECEKVTRKGLKEILRHSNPLLRTITSTMQFCSCNEKWVSS